MANIEKDMPVNGGALTIALKNGHVKSESKLYNAWVLTAIRRPALKIEHIKENSQIYKNLCKVRGYDPKLVRKGERD
mgnify:CR=1 FL=1